MLLTAVPAGVFAGVMSRRRSTSSPDIATPEDALDLLVAAITANGFSGAWTLGLVAAGSSFAAVKVVVRLSARGP